LVTRLALEIKRDHGEPAKVQRDAERLGCQQASRGEPLGFVRY
jgi:hypothetical protein